MNISFRPITPEDVPQIVRWLREEDVTRWWWDIAGKSDAELADEWITKALNVEHKEFRYIIVVDGNEIGNIQVSPLSNYPDCQAEVDIPNAAGVDVFIGEPEWRDRGIGSAMVRQFVDEIVFAMPGIETCTIDPDPENKRAIRAYEKAGYRYVRNYRSPEDNIEVYLMRRERPPIS
jgi:aminoglycoside 6'-N-acetyltransferase